MYSKMRSRMIRLAIFILIAELLLVAIFCCGRWGWKFLGFRVCESTHIEAVTVESGSVRLQGADPGIPPDGFLGYIYEEADGKLYVGVHFSGFFGIFEDSVFDVTIPVDSEVTEVYLRTGTGEYPIWNQDQGLLAE